MSTTPAISLPTLPGKAGALQRSGTTAELVAELGDNYDYYHADLARRLEALGGRPRRADHPSAASYLEAFAQAQAIVIAESTLRRCRGARRDGRALGGRTDLSRPLLDADERLVSV
jgi:hypothetical protein